MASRDTWRRAIIGVVLLAGAIAIPAVTYYATNVMGSPARYGNRPLRDWLPEFNSPEEKTREQAVFAVGAMGTAGAEGVPALAVVLRQDESDIMRAAAALALAKIAPASAAAVPELTEAMRDQSPRVRINAANALLRLGKEAAPAIPTLIAAISDKENDTDCGLFLGTIQEISATALARASGGEGEAMPTLIAALDGSKRLRITVAMALASLGANAKPALPKLTEMLKDKDAWVRQAAEEAIGEITGNPVKLPPGKQPPGMMGKKR